MYKLEMGKNSDLFGFCGNPLFTQLGIFRRHHILKWAGGHI